MLVTSKQMIMDAKRGGYAVGSFNTSDLEITKAIINAGVAQKSPLIIETSEKAISFAGLEEIAAIVKAEAKKANIPVALHLDHGGSLDIVSRCIEAGYTSVMFDGSRLDFRENKILTKRAAEMAHKNNIPCEGDLGAIKKTGQEKNYTDISEVVEFVRETRVDYLAVSIGSAHGTGGDESLNIEHLKKIRKITNIPLVLHGASGVPEVDIFQAIKCGICKINIDTDIRHTYAKAIRDIAKNFDLDDPRDIMTKVMGEIQKLVEIKIELFGSDGQIK